MRVAPVPAAGFSTMCSGVGPSIIAAQEGEQQQRDGVRPLAVAGEREVDEQLVEEQGLRPRANSPRRRDAAGTGGTGAAPGRGA